MHKKRKPALRRYFFDTEFNDTIGQFDIDFISIGIVDEKGNERYGISNEFNLAAAVSQSWIKENVINKLDHHATWKSLKDIRQEILDLIESAHEVEFWAKNGSYDNVLLCQIFGGMGPLRDVLLKEKSIRKMTFRDTKELLRVAENPNIKPMRAKDMHISINDARNERYVFNQCRKVITVPGIV